ncbi:MAG: 4Fe-4S binding protein [Parasporobacterium sp.]|nr:4Fe-4S binding protein [Parasporobacterium sp.]
MQGAEKGDCLERIVRNFEIPDAARDFVDFFFDEKEQKLIAEYGGKRITEADFPAPFLELEYHRGVLSKTDERGKEFVLNHFYGFLDVFCVSRPEYGQLSPAQKTALDDWYFDAYFDSLDKTQQCPTPDRVIPLEELLAEIDADPRPLYLNYCDCRSLTGNCGFPVRTCITYKNGINSFVDRGLAEPIDKETAKEILRDLDKEGLMHTTMGQSICNCCNDCCYLFRSQRRLQSYGTWPISKYRIHMDEDQCIGCSRCVTRCRLGVFRRNREQGISMDRSKCVGCGICVSTCPANALKLVERNGESEEIRG